MSRTSTSLPKGTKTPDHLAIILDGNRRWARSRGLSSSEGHRAGYLAMKNIARSCREFGIHTLTVWGFSTENWERSAEETGGVMSLVRRFLKEYGKEAKKEGVRIVHLGRKDRLPGDIVEKIGFLERRTRDYKNHLINIALDYGGKDEIVRAARKIVRDGVEEKDIDEKLFASYLDTADQLYPYVDLFIRTSGEQRTSGLMPWQMEYAEYYWEEGHLPDFTPARLREAILDYSRRRRRFGGNDAVEHIKLRPEVVAGLELSWWRLGNIPEGETFREYSKKHLKEQYGLSKELAGEAAGYMVEALSGGGKRNNWRNSLIAMKKFYRLIKSELKLAFEPEIAASLQVKLWKGLDMSQSEWNGEVEESAKNLYAEVYRISLFQAAKIAHLRVMASAERRLAEAGRGERHWRRAEDYLQRFYEALADRVS